MWTACYTRKASRRNEGVRMNLTTDWWIVWELRIALGLWIIAHALPVLDGLVSRLKR